LHPTTPRQTLVCAAHCYKLTRQVAFVRAIAHHGDEADAIASAVGTFRVFSSTVVADDPPEHAA
jgi:acyl-coenzyme A thioesterase PaaI-like protein